MTIISLWVFLLHCFFTFLCPSPMPSYNGTKVLAVSAKAVPSPTNIPSVMPLPTRKVMPTIIPKPTQPPQNPFIDQINAYRKSQGLVPVTSNDATCQFAKVRAGEIANSFNHDGFNRRLQNHTLPYPSYSFVTENIAMTSGNPITMWIASPGHAANMRADTPYVCVMQQGNFYTYEGWKP